MKRFKNKKRDKVSHTKRSMNKMEQKTCPRCRILVPLNAKFCPNCGSTLIEPTPYDQTPQYSNPPQYNQYRVGRSGSLTASGVLLIISATIALVGAILGFILFAATFYWFGEALAGLIVGIFGILGFSFGLTGAVLGLKRKQFAVSITGAVFVLVAGVLHFAMFAVGYAGIIFVLFFGIPIIILSIIGLILLAIRKKEFI
jgi:cation transport ATPase